MNPETQPRSALPTASLLHRCHIKRIAQICMPRQRVAAFALDQNVYPMYPRNIHRQRLHQRIHRQLFAENAGSVLVGKRFIQIDDSRARIDQVNASNVCRRGHRMRCARLLVNP